MRQFRIDGKVICGVEEKKCDYLLLNDDTHKSYYIELKGSEIDKAIKQLENTINLISPSLRGYIIYQRIVYRTGTHSVNSSAVTRWKQKNHGRAILRHLTLEEKL